MARPKKDETKEERLGIRLTSKIRYGLRLLAERLRVSEAEMISRCIESSLIAEDINVNKLWKSTDGQRLLALRQHAPHLLTENDMEILERLDFLENHYGHPIGGRMLEKAVHIIGVSQLVDIDTISGRELVEAVESDEAIPYLERDVYPKIDQQ